MKRIERIPVVVQENDKELCIVPLGPRQHKVAMIYKEDYDFLMKLGVSQAWNTLNKGAYVYAASFERGKASPVMIGRILMNAKEGQHVKYLDGDPTNLRRENMRLRYRSDVKRHDREIVMSQNA